MTSNQIAPKFLPSTFAPLPNSRLYNQFPSHHFLFSSVQFSRSVVSDSLQPHELQHTRPPCSSPTPKVYSNSCPSNHLILCCPLLLLPPVPPSIRVFSNESTLCMRWPKYWSFSFRISPSNEHPGLIFFRMDWLDLLRCLIGIKTNLKFPFSYIILVSFLNILSFGFLIYKLERMLSTSKGWY